MRSKYQTDRLRISAKFSCEWIYETARNVSYRINRKADSCLCILAEWIKKRECDRELYTLSINLGLTWIFPMGSSRTHSLVLCASNQQKIIESRCVFFSVLCVSTACYGFVFGVRALCLSLSFFLTRTQRKQPEFRLCLRSQSNAKFYTNTAHMSIVLDTTNCVYRIDTVARIRTHTSILSIHDAWRCVRRLTDRVLVQI